MTLTGALFFLSTELTGVPDIPIWQSVLFCRVFDLACLNGLFFLR